MRGRRLGSALRRYRESKRLDLKHAGEAVGCSTSKISRLESGLSPARVGDVRILLDLYEIEDPERRSALERLARQSSKQGWWVDYRTSITNEFADLVTLEADASVIRTWQPVRIPGILQTPDCTRALLAATPAVITDDEIEAVVRIRQERRRVIAEAGTPFAAVIWEPALASPMPTHSAHVEQLKQIAAVAREESVMVQVLPAAEWAIARIAGHFVTFAFSSESDPEVAAIDGLNNTLIIENSDEVALYARAFGILQSAALSPTDSADCLRSLIDRVSQGGEKA
ncbi:hypothetical protein SRB5_56450 [Streptomyces sp. RB5]|uniref:HTH cro/C1-type domain-containing protein n=1 Tax=Streptomyces smaragdinus TaxID=2585196 RepID=A0A7K0CQ50_9ACTN|nr:hypothetical protein [Streptomyces smaragdinus]